MNHPSRSALSVGLFAVLADKSGRDREHKMDREVIAAVYLRHRAAAGDGYTFQLPPSLREAS